MNLLERLLAPVRTLMLRLLFRSSVQREVAGIQLIVGAAHEHANTFFDRTQEALDLIENVDPRGWKRIRKYLRRIVLIRGGGEFYHAGLRAYVVDLPSMRTRSPADYASSMLHEATHGRLDQAGIRYPAALRGRVEAICVGQEIAFLKRLPNTQDLIAKKEAALETRWWSDESLHQRRVEQFRAHGFPRILVRAYDRLFRPSRAA